MSDYRIEAATKEEWANRALNAEAKLAKAAAMFKAIEMWDAAWGYPMPYRVRDPMRAVLAELEALREIATIRGVRT